MRKDIDETNLGFLLGKIKGLFAKATGVSKIEFTKWSGVETINITQPGSYYINSSFGDASVVNIKQCTTEGAMIEITNGNNNTYFLDFYDNPYEIAARTLIRCYRIGGRWRVHGMFLDVN